jgi:sterol desaturase/sphingolipid hydroxylase (fatty acid hydroxylase superfamily)
MYLQQSFRAVASSLIRGVSTFLSNPADPQVYREWIWLLGAIAVMDVFYRVWCRPKSESFWTCASLKRIYTHRSAAIDYKYFLLSMFLIQPVTLSAMVLGNMGARILGSTIGPSPAWTAGLGVMVVFLILTLVLFDIGHYCSHYLLHRIPALWELHKVHHSAEVLTPLTNYRGHPLEGIFASFFEIPMQALCLTWFFYLYGTGSSMTAFTGFNILYAAGYLLSGLRHSHIWVSFGPLLEHIVSSPAQHQIHHSTASRHIDKNFARYFSFVDWAFGTLYIPREEEDLVFGLQEGHDNAMDTITGILWVPLQRAFAIRKASRPGRVVTLLDCSNCDARDLQENR